MIAFSRRFLTAFGLAGLLAPQVGQAAPRKTPSAAQFAENRGAVAIDLGLARPSAPRLDAALSDWNGATRIERFYRVGGEGTALSGLPLTPTQARLSHDAQNLYVAFQCAEPSRYAWAAPTETGAALDAPDRVELMLRPGWEAEKFWRFAVASDGSFAARASKDSGPIRTQDDGGLAPEIGASNVEIAEFSARVVRFKGGWTAALTVPWSQIGGRPDGGFGLNVARFRQQSGEYLSPLALDATGFPPGQNPAPNAFLEASLNGAQGVIAAGAGLATLPSGVKFWNRPAVLRWPSRATRLQLWELQRSISKAPTNSGNFAARVALADRYVDVLWLEGFSFDRSENTWNPGAPIVDPRSARARINRLLRQGDAIGAHRELDVFLRGLDEIARHWWVDGSPGNVRADGWTRFSGPLRVALDGRALRLDGRAANRPLSLRVSLPATGGVRLRAQNGASPANGSIEPKTHLKLVPTRGKSGIVRARFAGGSVAVVPSPWQIVVFDAQNREKWRLKEGDLRFRFEGERVAAIDWSQGLRSQEDIWGFGEWPQRFGLRGTTLNLWQQDGYGALNGGLLNQSYKTIPFFHSSRGASVFSNSRARLRADIGQQNPDKMRLTASGATFDLFIWPGAPLENLKRYAELTGKPWLPPRWAFEPMAGGGYKRWANGPLKNPVEEQVAAMRRFAELDIPHSALYAEGPGSSRPQLYEALKPLGVRVMTWNRNQSPGGLRDIPDAQQPVLRRENGEIYTFKGGYTAAQFPYLDWTHPRVTEVWRAGWKKRLDLGVAGSMIDFGDWTPEDAVAFDGTRGDWLHNAYALDYHRAAYEVFKEKRGQDFLLFARQAAPGSQKYVAAFAGDYLTNFKGLRAALRASLNFCSSGFSTWSVELGGYSGGAPDRETYIRWVEWSAFTPLMRAHGQTPREPWEYGPDATRIYKKMAWTRQNIVPALQSAALEANRSGVPMIRALPLVYADQNLQKVDDQYLLGPDLLVAPLTGPGLARRVAFPQGRWVNFWNGAAHAGHQTQQIAAPLDEIPVFLREGALLPVDLAPSLKWGHSMSKARVAALVVTPPRAPSRRTWKNGKIDLAASSAPVADGFRVNFSPGGPQVLLIYGAMVTRATFHGQNGRALAASALVPRRNGRVVLRLPKGTRRVQISIAKSPNL